MYFVIYDTVQLFQNFSVDECETEDEAFRKLDEAKKIYGWNGWVAKEVERPTQRAIDPLLADSTRTNSKNMFVTPESRTDCTVGN